MSDATQAVADDYELAETVHGEIVRIRARKQVGAKHLDAELIRDLMLLMESYTAYAGDSIPGSLLLRSQELHARLDAIHCADGPVGLDGTQFNFKVGDLVQKKTGYLFPGKVAAAFLTQRGYRRYVVEALHPDFDSMLHIFSEEQLCEREPNA